ncbi:hypothetical protein SABVI_0990 [Streptococcus anginosus]|nr:hypothetical protein SABVI_0990 [Streptococcus anginosus]
MTMVVFFYLIADADENIKETAYNTSQEKD